MIRTRPLLISTILTLAAGFVLAPTPTTAQQPKAQVKRRAAAKARAEALKPVVHALGLTIYKSVPAPKAEPEPSASGTDGAVFNAGPTASMNMMFRVDLPGRNVIGIDESASKLTEFGDDKGTDMLKADPAHPTFFSEASFTPRPRADSEPHSVTIDLARPQAPATGALKISLKADLVVLCSDSAKTAEHKDAAVKVGTKITAGPFSCTIAEIEASEVGDFKFQVTLRSSQSFKGNVKDLSFVDPDGKPLKSQLFSDGSGSKIFTRTYGLDRQVDKVTVKVVYFDKVESIHVPVELSAGVGL
jgi:hypothetical protein